MPANTDGNKHYQTTRQKRHPHCFVCSPGFGGGLQIQFEAGDAGSVEGTFYCTEGFTGYPGFLHGGITSALLDGAMTNCLMARGTPGLTGKLEVRFLKPVLIGQEAVVRAWWEKSKGPLHIMGAELLQNGEVLASAAGRFMDYPEPGRAK